MKNYLNKTNIHQYLLDQLTGNFAGFLIGTSATGMLSHFFETRSVRNLWGMAAHKKILDKETFSNLEWVLSLLIGFLVFELMTKVLKPKITENYPHYKFKVLRLVITTSREFNILQTKIKNRIFAMRTSQLEQR